MNIKIKKLVSDAIIPLRGSEEAAGYDLCANSLERIVENDSNLPKECQIDPMVSFNDCKNGIYTVKPHETVKVHTGLAMELPSGYFGAVFARSGLSTKQGMRPANCVGVVDSDYRGEIIVALHNDTDAPKTITKDMKVAQIVLMPYISMEFEEVKELDSTERGEGGFGSTGTH